MNDCQCQEEDEKFWEGFVAILLRLVCHIERGKLNRKHTTAELRKAGKDSLCDKDG